MRVTVFAGPAERADGPSDGAAEGVAPAVPGLRRATNTAAVVPRAAQLVVRAVEKNTVPPCDVLRGFDHILDMSNKSSKSANHM
jgi:hypothetical protein